MPTYLEGQAVQIKRAVAIVGFAAFLVLACSSGDALSPIPATQLVPSGNTNKVNQYFFEQQAVLKPALDIVKEWNKLTEEDTKIDSTKLTFEKLSELLIQQLNTATLAYRVTRDSHIKLGSIAPPRRCREYHLFMTEALQLTEAALVETIASLKAGMGDGADPDAYQRHRIKANTLFIKSDKSRQRASFLFHDCIEEGQGPYGIKDDNRQTTVFWNSSATVPVWQLRLPV